MYHLKLNNLQFLDHKFHPEYIYFLVFNWAQKRKKILVLNTLSHRVEITQRG